MPRSFEITGRRPGQVIFAEMAGAFHLGAASDLPTETVVTTPGWTLFCLDLATREAVFVDIGAATDLAEAPFSHRRQ